MAMEIERKFLISDKLLLIKEIKDLKPLIIKQGYLNNTPERTVRVRTTDDKAYITVKGIAKGISRPEFEYEIPHADALEMFALCESYIEKDRYVIPLENDLKWEIDVFHANNEGLFLAEIELPTEMTAFYIPDWLGKEVSEDSNYTNSVLSRK